MAVSTTFTNHPRAVSVTVNALEIAVLANLIQQNKLEDKENVLRAWPQPTPPSGIGAASTYATRFPTLFSANGEIKTVWDNFTHEEILAAAYAAINGGDPIATLVATTPA